MPEPRQETDQQSLTARDRHGRRFRTVLIARVLIFLSLTAGFLWYSDQRLRKLDLQIRAAQHSADALSQRVMQFTQEMDLLREKTETARREASEAKQKAGESAAAQRQSEVDAQQAREESEAARAELDRLRQVREKELDRMREALNRVAPTRRTASGMVIELGDASFRFDFDSAVLRPENRELLSRIAGVLLASTGYSLFVYGHTDDIGTDEYNQELSDRRAQSVREYLVQAGLPPALIQTKGFGKSSPLVAEKTREARERNRRVEIGIVDTMIRYEGEANRRLASPQP